MADKLPALDPAALSAFVATLGNLPGEEIKKAKQLYIRNAITGFHADRDTGKTMLIVMGVMCIIPIFLIIFIPALMSYRIGIKAGREKILNALEVWQDDLGPDYAMLRGQIE